MEHAAPSDGGIVIDLAAIFAVTGIVGGLALWGAGIVSVRFERNWALSALATRFRIAVPGDPETARALAAQTYAPHLAAMFAFGPAIALGIVVGNALPRLEIFFVVICIAELVCFAAFSVTFVVIDRRSGRVTALERSRGGFLYYLSPWRLGLAVTAVALSALPLVVGGGLGLLDNVTPNNEFYGERIPQLPILGILTVCVVTLALWFSLNRGVAAEADQPNWLDVQRKSAVSWWLALGVIGLGPASNMAWSWLGSLSPTWSDGQSWSFTSIGLASYLILQMGGVLSIALPAVPTRRQLRRAAAAAAAEDAAVR